MAGKDITEKTLIAYNDVFADIINVLLFGGKRIVKEHELQDAVARSMYKADGKLHEMERDTAKYWKQTSFRIALIGIENQTDTDPDMALRLFGYDGAGYRAQLLTDKNENKKAEQRKRRYPVISLVLYFGSTRWTEKRTLKESIQIRPELEPFVNDYKINLFEISYLSDEQIALFRSDFRFVAEFFVKQRTDPGYTPTEIELQHVDEVLKLLSVFAVDDRFLEQINEQVKENNISEGGKKTMSSAVLDFREARGMEKGLEKGIEKGQNLLVEAVQRLRSGETPEEIEKSGVDKKTVELAQTIR